MLFVLYLNPLYFLLKKCKFYSSGRARKLQHTHNLRWSDIIIKFSGDINIQFGEDKCAYLQREKGKVMQNLKPILINNLTIKPIKEGDNYKDLGIDENISYNCPINKKRVTKGYINRIRKTWDSQLSVSIKQYLIRDCTLSL